MKSIISLTVLFFVCFNCLGQLDSIDVPLDTIKLDTTRRVFFHNVIVRDTIFYVEDHWVRGYSFYPDSTYEKKRPTARLHLMARTADVGTPMKLNSGTFPVLIDSGDVEAGAIRFYSPSVFPSSSRTYFTDGTYDNKLSLNASTSLRVLFMPFYDNEIEKLKEAIVIQRNGRITDVRYGIVTNCEEYKKFIENYPRYEIPSKIINHFKICQ